MTTFLPYVFRAFHIDGRFKSVEILDTAGAHEFPAMKDLNIKRGQAFFVVYSIDNRQSFDDAVSLLDVIQRVKCESSAYYYDMQFH